MEHENDYKSNGIGVAALITSIGAGILALMNGGLRTVLGNNGTPDAGSAPVTRFDLEQASKIAALETEVKLRDSYIYTDGKFAATERELSDQRVYNATMNGAIACIQGQIAQLQSLTRIVIPNTSVQPGWGNVTVTPAAAPTT